MTSIKKDLAKILSREVTLSSAVSTIFSVALIYFILKLTYIGFSNPSFTQMEVFLKALFIID